MIIYKGIRFDDHSHSEDDEYDYNWSQICTACACEHGIYSEAAKNDCPASLICGVEGCDNDAEFYLDFDGSETIVEDDEQTYSGRDYGPGNPWDAPGMSVKDFI